ncbi:MAG: hypothetical protein IPF71_18400 [Rhodoferax sp.]|nr:hypothetical protein [Rhodoferax sp.]
MDVILPDYLYTVTKRRDLRYARSACWLITGKVVPAQERALQGLLQQRTVTGNLGVRLLTRRQEQHGQGF